MNLVFFEKVSLVTGGFDPIHSGHLHYFDRAKDFSDYLVVGLNGDPWLKRKKGQYFQCWTERADIVRHLDMVDAVISWDDADDSACGAIEKCLDIAETVVFCNGGDRGALTLQNMKGSRIMNELSLNGVWVVQKRSVVAPGSFMDTLRDNVNY